MSYSYSLTSTSRGGRGDDVTSFPPEMDDAMMEDRLEQARLNRTNYYRRMLASRTRPMEDHLVTRKSTTGYTGGSRDSPGSGASISDTPGTIPVPEIPEPHCSWRFYTSYDNGEWKRHAVPVDHDVEEILREPTKTQRRERDKVSPPPSIETISSIRRARQAGGPLLACIQPRAKRTSESSNDLAIPTTTTTRAVGFQGPGGQVINGMDAQLIGQLGPAELMGLCGNQELVRQILEGGGLVVPFDGENHPPGNVKQEFTSKYMSTVTVKEPAGGVKSPGPQGVGGAADVAKAESDGAGVSKSRRPRIYGFQEKIIIPTKYKTSVENQENDVTAAKTDSTSHHHTGTKVIQDSVKVNGVASSGADDVKKTETRVVGSSTARSSPGRTKPSPGSQTVKVVVVNSGSDVESERRPEELKEVEKEEQKKEEGGELAEVARKEPGKTETFAPSFVMQEGLTPMENFQAFQDNFRRQFENASAEKKDGAVVEKKEEEKGSSSSSSHPGQRLFSKDEQTFSDVGPDGQKRDGKVVHTYEVVTTTDGDPSPAKVEEGPLSIKEIPITPVPAVRSKSAAISFTPGAVEIVREDSARGTSPFGGGGGSRSIPFPLGAVEIVRDDSARGTSPFVGGGGRRSVEIVRERGSAGGRSPLAARRTVLEESSFSSSSPTAERRGVRTASGGDVSIFDQTGSLFKQISPRPRAEREREFASPRDTRQWSRDQGVGGVGGGGGYNTGRAAATTTTNTTATRTRTDGSAEQQPQVARRKVVIVREMDMGGGGDSQERCSATSSQKTVEVVREGDGDAAGHHPGIVFREPDGKADQSGTRTTVKIVRETGSPLDATDRTVKTSWESGSGISSSDGAASFGGRGVLFASPTGRENPDPVQLASPPPPSGSTTKQPSCVGDRDTSAEQWEVQVAVKD